MSNAVATNGAVPPSAVPAWAANKPSQGFAGLPPQESLGDGIGQSYGVITYRGKNWGLRYQGQQHLFTRPDDNTPASYIDVVVLRTPGVKAKSFYADGFDENASLGKRPTCASLDGVKPDPDVVQKQADACALCPRNVFHTDARGKKSRDCSDYLRLAVLVLPHQTTRMLGTPLMDPVFLRVPPDSLQDLASMGNQMQGLGWHYSSFITRISFDSLKAHPKFVWRAQQPLTDEEAAVILEKRNDPLALRITGEHEIALRGDAPVQVATQPVPAIAPPSAPPPVVHATPPQPVFTAAVTAPPAPPPPIATQSVAPQVVDLRPNVGGAFGLPPPPPADQPPPQPGAAIGQTVEDTGMVDDPDLEAKINAMLNV